MFHHPHVIYLVDALVTLFITFLWALLFHFKSFLCYYMVASQIIFNGLLRYN